MQRAALASFDASRFDTLLGPPPPPLATSLRVLSGACVCVCVCARACVCVREM